MSHDLSPASGVTRFIPRPPAVSHDLSPRLPKGGVTPRQRCHTRRAVSHNLSPTFLDTRSSNAQLVIHPRSAHYVRKQRRSSRIPDARFGNPSKRPATLSGTIPALPTLARCCDAVWGGEVWYGSPGQGWMGPVLPCDVRLSNGIQPPSLDGSDSVNFLFSPRSCPLTVSRPNTVRQCYRLRAPPPCSTEHQSSDSASTCDVD